MVDNFYEASNEWETRHLFTDPDDDYYDEVVEKELKLMELRRQFGKKVEVNNDR